MSRKNRWSAVVFVLACLTASTAQAWPLGQDQPGFAAPPVVSRLAAAWDWLASQIRRAPATAPSPPAPQRKAGCTVDPDGKPISCNY